MVADLLTIITYALFLYLSAKHSKIQLNAMQEQNKHNTYFMLIKGPLLV